MKPNCYLQMGVGYIFSNASLVGGHEHSFGAEVFVGELPSSNPRLTPRKRKRHRLSGYLLPLSTSSKPTLM